LIPTLQDFGKGADFDLLNIYCIPTKPGHVRLIVRDFLAVPGGPPLGLRIAGLMPQWFHDLQGLDITDGDTVLLNRQASRVPHCCVPPTNPFPQNSRASIALHRWQDS
jgi:hypothetical protein